MSMFNRKMKEYNRHEVGMFLLNSAKILLGIAFLGTILYGALILHSPFILFMLGLFVIPAILYYSIYYFPRLYNKWNLRPTRKEKILFMKENDIE